MRLCPAFVNRKTDICSVFGLFFQDFPQFHGFSLDLCALFHAISRTSGRRFFSMLAQQRRVERIHQRSCETEAPDHFACEILLQRRRGRRVASTPHCRHKSRSIAGWSLGKPFGGRVSGMPVKESIVRLQLAVCEQPPHLRMVHQQILPVSPAAAPAPAYTRRRQSAPPPGRYACSSRPRRSFPDLHATTRRRYGFCTAACQKKIVCRDRCASYIFEAGAHAREQSLPWRRSRFR